MSVQRFLGLVLILAALVVATYTPGITAVTQAPTTPLPVSIPPLPFNDNLDPALCGIPDPDGRHAVVTGTVEGELVQPIVYLYDSHSRNRIVGQVYPTTRVAVELRQINPALNFYFVRTIGVAPPQSGWIPEPFLLFSGGS